MRTRVFLLAVAAVLFWPATAEAKGAVGATVEGAGITPISVSGEEGQPGAFNSLMEQAGFFPVSYGQQPDVMMDEAPAADLGPRLVVTWRVPSGENVMALVRQELYPWAEGGPLTYTEPGQTFLGSQVTRGGWYRAPASLIDTLALIGVPSRSALDMSAVSTTVTAASATQAAQEIAARDANGGIDVPVVWTVALATTIVACAVLGGRRILRRRAHMAPV